MGAGVEVRVEVRVGVRVGARVRGRGRGSLPLTRPAAADVRGPEVGQHAVVQEGGRRLGVAG